MYIFLPELFLVYFQENSIKKAFVYISFEKLCKLGQPYKMGQKVSNYFVPEYTPPSVFGNPGKIPIRLKNWY